MSDANVLAGAPPEPEDRAVTPAGVADPVQVDYFGVDHEEKVMLDDGISWVMVRELDEGGRRKYLNETNRDIRLERDTGDAHLRMATGDERANLLKLAIVDWNLQTTNPKTGAKISPPCDRKHKDLFLTQARPVVLDKIEKKVRDMNEWLLPAENTIEAIDEQIEQLEEMRAKLVEREEGKDD